MCNKIFVDIFSMLSNPQINKWFWPFFSISTEIIILIFLPAMVWNRGSKITGRLFDLFIALVTTMHWDSKASLWFPGPGSQSYFISLPLKILKKCNLMCRYPGHCLHIHLQAWKCKVQQLPLWLCDAEFQTLSLTDISAQVWTPLRLCKKATFCVQMTRWFPFETWFTSGETKVCGTYHLCIRHA